MMELVIWDQIVVVVCSWIGMFYVYQVSCKGVGCDCFGLLCGVWCEVMGFELEVLLFYMLDWVEWNQKEMLWDVVVWYFLEIDLEMVVVGDVLLFVFFRYLLVKYCVFLIMCINEMVLLIVYVYEYFFVLEVVLVLDWWKKVCFVFLFLGVVLV